MSWDSKTYEGKVNWCSYYQKISAQHYERWKAGRTETDHQLYYEMDAKRAREILFEIVGRYDNTGQVKPEIVKREMIAEYKASRARVASQDCDLQLLMREIQQAKRDLDRVECNRENENGVKTPEYERYNRIAERLWAHKDLPCYKAAPVLWEMYTQQHKATCALSIQEVLDATV